MAHTCTVCRHPHRAEIDAALARSEPLRSIAERHGTSQTSVHRHKNNCLVGAVQAAVHEGVVESGKSVLDQIKDLQARTFRILDMAESAEKLTPAVMAIAAARQNLELLAKLTGELNDKPTINIMVHPDWMGLRDTIMTALAPHPDALEAVVCAIEERASG